MIRYRPGAALPQPLRLRPEMPSPFSPDGGGFYLPKSVETFHPAGASAEIPSIRSHTSGRQRTTLDEMNLQRGKGCTLAMRLWLVLSLSAFSFWLTQGAAFAFKGTVAALSVRRLFHVTMPYT